MKMVLNDLDYQLLATSKVKPAYKYDEDNNRTDEIEGWMLSGVAWSEEMASLSDNSANTVKVKLPKDTDSDILKQITNRTVVKLSNITAIPYSYNGFVKVSLRANSIEIVDQM